MTSARAIGNNDRLSLNKVVLGIILSMNNIKYSNIFQNDPVYHELQGEAEQFSVLGSVQCREDAAEPGAVLW